MNIKSQNGESKESELERASDDAECESTQHEVTEHTVLVLDLGEGWRSVARGVEAVFPGAMIVGADKRGSTRPGWDGAAVGKITAELKHDLSTAATEPTLVIFHFPTTDDVSLLLCHFRVFGTVLFVAYKQAEFLTK